MTTVTCDETQHKNYTVPVGRFALHTSVYEPNFVDMHHNELICLGESNNKEEPINISDKKKLTHCSWWNYSLASALYYMGDERASEYIIRRKQKSLSFIHSKGRMQFCCDTHMGR